MADETLTFGLGGDVPLDLFAVAVRHLDELVAALTVEVGNSQMIDWMVDDLQPGSATATIRGTVGDEDVLQRVIHAYESVGQALEAGREPPYSKRVVNAARGILSVLDGRITSVRFETANSDATITSQLVRSRPAQVVAFGMIEGQVQTLTSRHRYRFTLYDRHYDRAVSCYLERSLTADDAEEIMREAWGRRVRVEGVVARDGSTGRPQTVRRITRVDVIPPMVPGSYRQARAVLAYAPGDPLPEEVIRRWRDA